MARTVEKGRSAETGQFVPIDYAKKHPKTTVIEKYTVDGTLFKGASVKTLYPSKNFK